ncbi:MULTISPECIES: hypothetical protein [Romboutsia]|uniref:hypothetical protein n=1 Tax=Romboutsia TaxID=1501226 RepID=UPI002172DDED|nr:MULTISPECIES: hypothetical protein [Romboutsia]MCI6667462.1 hypothetical protein [Romboutsia timonensis]MCI9258728.1 hypothetical protein [Romboutsia sp.]MDY3958910.1 hypothetical protein [Romboutsia timonensis]
MLNNNLEINGLISNFDEDVKRIPEQEFIKSLNLNKKSPYYKKRLEIIKSFYNDEVRRDHYEELGMTFYKISARMDINKYKNKHKKEDIIEDILALPIKPSSIWIDGNELTLEFRPKEYFHFKSYIDYLKLVLSFIDFIEEYKEFKLYYDGDFDDDPELISKGSMILSDVKFSKDIFDTNRIDIYDEDKVLMIELNN